MKKAIILIGVVLLVAAAKSSAAAKPALTGKMGELNYLIGTWSCSTKVPAMEGMPAGTHTGTISFEVEPNNTVGYDLSAQGYSGAGYLGYADAKKLWWSTGADSFGGVTLETGASGNVLTGWSYMAGERYQSRDTITKTSDTKYEDLYQMQKGGTWTMGADAVCTKTSSTPQ